MNTQEAKLRIAEAKAKKTKILDLSGLSLVAIPSQVETLVHLEGLRLTQNKLTELPTQVKRLKHLCYLFLGYNNLSLLPDLSFFPNLEELYIHFNQLERIPEALAQLIRLRALDLNHNPLKECPGVVLNLPNLEVLRLADTGLTVLPPEISHLSKLVELNLSGNSFIQLPDSLFELKELRVLELYKNNLTHLPPGIDGLAHLKVLELYKNNFSTLPKGIEKLNKLERLGLSHNNLGKFPMEILALTQLRALSLSSNEIVDIPPEISQLASLTYFSLTHNKLSRIPAELGKMHHIKELRVKGNPLENPPLEISIKGVKAIGQYYNDLEDQGKGFIYEAKLVLLGEPGAGKTSLAEKLLNSEYELNPAEPMTKGISVMKWIFPFDQNQDFQANIWDFGGQEIMHATHRYFLTRRSLYVLVADNRKEDTDFFYWLNILRHFTDKSPVIIVLNEKHGLKKHVPEVILATFANIRQVHRINLRDNNGLELLSSSLQNHLRELPHVGKVPIPVNWLKVRAKLEALSLDKISRLEYLAICKEFGINKTNDSLRISEYLHDLGVILHFQEDRVLRNTLILNTRWATEAVYKVLFDELVFEQKGKFGSEDLDRLWTQPEYPMAAHLELLQLMVNFKLCYRLGVTGSYIIPHMLPESPPDEYIDLRSFIEPASVDTQVSLRCEFQYPFMPKGLISRIIVELNNYIYKDIQWKGGVVLHILDSWIEIVEFYHDRKLSIRIIGENRVGALAILRKEMYEIHESFDDLEAEEMIPCECPGCTSLLIPHFFRYSLLQRYLKEGVGEIRCEKFIRNLVNVRRLLEGLMHESLSDIRNMIAYGLMRQAIDALLESPEYGHRKAVIMLTSRFLELEENVRKGLIGGDEERAERNRIRLALLGLLDDL